MCVTGGMGVVRVCSGRQAPNSTVQRGNSVGVHGAAVGVQAGAGVSLGGWGEGGSGVQTKEAGGTESNVTRTLALASLWDTGTV